MATLPGVLAGTKLALASLLLASCSKLSCESEPSLTPPTRLCVREPAEAACRPAPSIATLLADPDLQILGADGTEGYQNALRLLVSAPGDGTPILLRAKWRALSTTHGLNDPRKEIAAFAVQKLFLRPEDWIVPPATGHCFDLGHYRTALSAEAEASFPGLSCVFGTLSYWLEHAKGLEDADESDWLPGSELLHRELFEQNASYRRTLADTNLLLHLVDNGDTHRGQFVLTGGPEHPRLHCVDFTIAFSDFRNPKIGDHDWSVLRVPALPKSSVERLRMLRFSDLERLAVIEEWENRGGHLYPVAPTRPLQRREGLHYEGGRLQLGLTDTEIDRVWTRIRGVLAAVDAGEIRLF